MAHGEGRPRSNEFRLSHVRSVFPVSFRYITNKDRVGLKLTYMACADPTEVTIPHNMWHKPSMLRGGSGISLRSPVPQSGNTNERDNDAIDINRISAEKIGEQEKVNPRIEQEKHAKQKVVLLSVILARTNERGRLIRKKTCIALV